MQIKWFDAKWKLFAFYVAIYTIVTWLMREFVLTAELYQNAWGDQLESSRVNELLEQQKSISWLAYLFIPVMIYLQILFPTVCIYVYMQLREKKLKWAVIFRIALEAHIILMLPLVLKMLWFVFVPPENLQQVSNFSPWSLAIFLNDDAPAFLRYIFQSLNIFELAYIFTLIASIRTVLHTTIRQTVTIVGSSYGFGLIGWMAIVSFIFIQLQ